MIRVGVAPIYGSLRATPPNRYSTIGCGQYRPILHSATGTSKYLGPEMPLARVSVNTSVDRRGLAHYEILSDTRVTSDEKNGDIGLIQASAVFTASRF